MPTLPVLKRFEMTVYKNKDANDAAQVPAEATIEFYRQGATVKIAPAGQITSAGFTVVTVYNTGDILGNAIPAYVVQKGTSEALTMEVRAVDEVAGTIELKSKVGPIDLAVGDRLVCTSERPGIYDNPLGEGTGATSVTTNSTTGRYGGYMKAYRYDVIVKIPPTSPTESRLIVDCVGSFEMR